MNQNDIDQRARRAGSGARVHGAGIADTDRAWSGLLQLLGTGDDVVADVDLDRFGRTSGSGRRAVAVAASLIVLVGLAATFVAVRAGSDDDGASSGATSQFVLPRPGSDFVASNGSVSPAPQPDDIGPRGSIDVLGRRDGDVYRSLVQVLVTDSPRFSTGTDLAGEDVLEPIDTPTGPAYVTTFSGSMVVVTQDRVDHWVEIDAAIEDRQVAIDLLSQVAAGGTGEGIRLDLASPLEVLETVILGGVEGLFEVTSFDVAGPGINSSGIGPVLVETVRYPGALIGSVGTAETVQRVTVGGRPGWEARRTDVDGAWAAVLWTTVDDVLIAVSGHETSEIVWAVSESLVDVDEATWRAITGVGPAAAATTVMGG